MRTIRDLGQLTGKTVLVRVDFNVENADDALRLRRSMPTIRHLLGGGAKVLLISHRGRPAGKVVPELSLEFAMPFLREHLGSVVSFISDFDFGKIMEQLSSAKDSSLFLLENIRFLPQEEAMDIEFAKELASLGDIYVNDAFAVSHHPSVSVSVLPTILRPYAGLLLDSEIIHLTRAMEEPAQPLVVVVAGGKAVDKFAVIKNLYKAADKFLVGGILGNSFLKDRGVDVGSSHVDPEITNQIHELLHDPKIIVPEDWIADEAGTILDMGPISRKKFAEVLIKAKTVIWNGPLGKFEDPRYRAGSRAVADAIIASGAFSVVGGGETTQFLLEEKLADDFTFLSTGGGAMLDYLAGKDLPGITVLR